MYIFELVEISNCEFHKNQILLFNHMVFNETVVINEVSEFAGEFKNCDFNGGLYILNSDITVIQFTNCTFNGFRLEPKGSSSANRRSSISGKRMGRIFFSMAT